MISACIGIYFAWIDRKKDAAEYMMGGGKVFIIIIMIIIISVRLVARRVVSCVGWNSTFPPNVRSSSLG